MNRKSLAIGIVLSLVLILGSSQAVAGKIPTAPGDPVLMVDSLNGSTGMGSTIGPGGALYVTEGAAGKISRLDPKTAEFTTFATGLPAGNPYIGIGGVMDVAFIGKTAYALVTLVSPDVGGSDTVGIYRVDGPDPFSVVADIGKFAANNPPETDFFVPSGLQYALETFRGGFLVMEVASGARLNVDVEIGCGRKLYALSQGVWNGAGAGSPALPNTGALVEVNGDGTFSVLADGLDRPTSLEFIGNSAYFVNLAGEVWRIDGVSGPPYGVSD